MKKPRDWDNLPIYDRFPKPPMIPPPTADMAVEKIRGSGFELAVLDEWDNHLRDAIMYGQTATRVTRTPSLRTFSNAELIALGFSMLIAVLVSLDGKTHWLEGAQLLTLYLVIALSFYFVGR